MPYSIRTNIDPSATSGTELADITEEIGDLTQIVVESDTSNQPGGPSEGDAYIANGDASWVNGSQYDVAVFRDSTWIYHTPEEGWVAYIKDRGEARRFNGTDWNSRLLDSSPEHATDSGTDTYVSATNTDAPKTGDKTERDFQSANTTTTPTLDSLTITTKDGSALWAGALSGVHELQLNAGGTAWLVIDPNPSQQRDLARLATSSQRGDVPAILDEDDMASDSNAAVPTQQSVVRYNEDLYRRFVAGTNQYATIQAAVDAVAATAGTQGAGEVYIPAIADGKYSEQIEIPDGSASYLIHGQGTNTRIEGSGDHALNILSQDVRVADLWIDQGDGSGNFDAIRIPTGSTEVRLSNLDIDFAPRFGVSINSGANRGHITAVDIKGGQTAGLFLAAQWWTISGLELNSIPGRGGEISGHWNSGSSIVARGSGSEGLLISGDHNNVTIIVTGNGAEGLVITGNNNTVNVVSEGNQSNGVRISGSDNTVVINEQNNNLDGLGGDGLFINSGADNNKIFGRVTSVSDNGTGNTFYT